MSLKARLIAALCALVIVALAATDAVTYTSYRSYVLDQLDQQLYRLAGPVLNELGGADLFGGGQGNFANQFITPGTLATELTGGDQQVVAWQSYEQATQSFEPATQFPTVPASLASLAASGDTPVYATLSGSGNVRAYRVLVANLYIHGVKTGDVLAEAVPLTETDATLARLLRLELLVSGAVLIALAAATWLIIRISLRPLEKMADTAGEIAAGDLSQRVEETDDRTEVGRLGSALNIMLGRIETAFREREASELRLRRFVADASHELRTPLTSIRGYAELFQHGLADRPADLDTAMRRIDSESTRMAGLVDDLLLLARIDQGRPLERELVDLSTLASDGAQDARVIDPTRTVTLETPPSCPIVGDEGRLRQLVGNLVSNALAYTPAGTPFEIIVTLPPPEGATLPRATISVVDHGPGIPPESAEHVFERFWRSDPARVRAQGGAGLGLSIVSAIAEAHGGRVWVVETPGGGATFSVELPTDPSGANGAGVKPGGSWGAEDVAREPTGNGAVPADAGSFAGSEAAGGTTSFAGSEAAGGTTSFAGPHRRP